MKILELEPLKDISSTLTRKLDRVITVNISPTRLLKSFHKLRPRPMWSTTQERSFSSKGAKDYQGTRIIWIAAKWFGPHTFEGPLWRKTGKESTLAVFRRPQKTCALS